MEETTGSNTNRLIRSVVLYLSLVLFGAGSSVAVWQTKQNDTGAIELERRLTRIETELQTLKEQQRELIETLKGNSYEQRSQR